MRGIDGFEHSDGDAAQAAITTLLSTVFADTRRWARATSREARALVGELGGAALEAMYAGDSAAQRARVLALCRRMDAVADRDDYSSTTAWAAYSSSPSFHWMNVLELALARLLKKRHDYQEPELLALIAAARRHHGISKADVLGHVERHVGDGDCSPALREALESLSERIFKKPLKARAAALLAGAGTRAVAEAQAAQRVYHLRPLTAWSRQAVSDLLAETDEHKASWRRLFRLTLEGASQPRPTQAWQNETNQLLTRIGRQRAAQLLVRWLELTPDGADRAIENENADVLRALAWAASLLGEMPLGGAVELARALGVAASACFAKVYNVGARCARAANAC
ncbi:MAG: hypothetical protein KC503_34325, partial [Myxococcales bacterium]|nr:hypothetical protein [Myxococcales bacterium]